MNEILIRGKVLTHEKLGDEAENLRKLYTQLCVANQSLGRLTVAQQKGDWFTIQFIIQSGEISDLIDLIDDIKEKVVKISNEICPD